MSETALRRELLEVERKEAQIIGILEHDRRHKKNTLRTLREFHFADFARTVVGTTMFSAPVLVYTRDFFDLINSLPDTWTYKLFIAHLFFVFCVFITLNYSYRSTFTLDKEYLKQLAHRLLLIYMTVVGTIILLLWAFNIITEDISTLRLIRYVISAASLGIVGAVTFSFLAGEKND